MLAVYVSGHGFGHSTRTAEVLAELRRLEPTLPIVVVTAAPAFLFQGLQVEVRALACDVGLVQRGPLAIDEDATAAACAAFQEGWPALVEQESSWLRRVRARGVLADIPALGFAAAQAAGIPAVGLGNFSWDWIYRELARGRAAMSAAAAAAAAAYGAAELLLELPFAGDLAAFPRRERIPLVARKPRLTRGRAREALALPVDRPVVLLSFGGFGWGVPRPDSRSLDPLRERFLFLDEPDVSRARLDSLGLCYQDVVAAADVVVTKPGYGIVSDAIGAGTRLVYTERGDFPEYPILVEGMATLVPAAFVSGEDLRAGRLATALEDVLARPYPPRPRMDGASVAASRLRETLGLLSRPNWPAGPS
jgi:L-arabinokinase